MSKGIHIFATTSELIIRTLLQDASGALVTTGTTNLKLYELQYSDGSLKSYDFSSNTFKTTALTTENGAMTHRTGNAGTTNTGLWTYRLATLTGFTVGNIYFSHITNTSASPPAQVREFQWGSAEGDLIVESSFLEVDVEHWRTSQPSILSSTFVQSYIPGDVLGKVLGGGASTITGTGAQSQLQNPQGIKKNTALSNFGFKMFNTSGVPTAGLTVTGTVSIDGAAYVALTNSVVEVANGTYKINLAAVDLNGRNIMLRFTATGAKDTDIEIVTVEL